ncbi:MAG: hypothetical protein KDD29_10600 [Flavobacteriales bacterium]|nr:hypothetical protein [Flavobacteriales bacterium]
MKKALLVLAFTGLLAGTAFAGNNGDDKDKGKKAKKECCKKSKKACAGEKKEGCDKAKKSCCKKKAEEAKS